MASGKFADTPSVPTRRSGSWDPGTTLAARVDGVNRSKPKNLSRRKGFERAIYTLSWSASTWGAVAPEAMASAQLDVETSMEGGGRNGAARGEPASD